MFCVFGHLIVQILKFEDDFKYHDSYPLICLGLSFDDLKQWVWSLNCSHFQTNKNSSYRKGAGLLEGQSAKA
jgi:hypothetical protein